MTESDYAQYAELKAWSAEDFGRFAERDAAYYDAEIGRPKAAGEKLLEIGFGNGSLLGWAAAHGYVVTGVELQTELADRARRIGIAVVDDPMHIEPGNYDVIAAFDVFEHIEVGQLGPLLNRIQQGLKSGGRLIARFPNGDSPYSMPTFNGDLTHITWLGRGKVEMLMFEAGFKAYELRAPCEAYGLRSKIKLAPKLALRFFHRSFAKLAYLGASVPSTFHINYVLVANKP